MITTIAVSIAITVIILLILFTGMMNLAQSVIIQDNKTMLVRLTTLTDRYIVDQQQIEKNLIELASQLHDFSISIDDVMTAMFDSSMKFPREDERRTIEEFSPEDFVDKLNRSKSRLDGSAMEDLKNIFLDIEKFKESNEEEDTNEE
jgi:ABC-type transport system involved in multi-copper enzyme maturation permease subunit